MSIDLDTTKKIAEALIDSAIKGHGNLLIAVIDGTPVVSYSAAEFEDQLEAFVDSIAPGEGFYDRGEDSTPDTLTDYLNRMSAKLMVGYSSAALPDPPLDQPINFVEGDDGVIHPVHPND